MKKRLLELCGYGEDAKSLELVERVSRNYSHFDEVVGALEKLEPFLKHSPYYLSLLSERDMIQIKSDEIIDEDEFFTIDSEIIVWANENGVDIEENERGVCILGMKRLDD